MKLHRKACANSLCGDTFEYKNPKKRFCNLYCKNQAAYHYRTTEYEWEEKVFKSRRKNLQILEYLMNKKTFKMNLPELEKIGFDFTAALIPFDDEKGQKVFRYGNIGMRILSKTECELFNFKT